MTGGERILEETGGWFVPPTIFDNVRNDMTIAREEIFGPVLSVIEFDTEAEAVAIANDTPYGLAASLYTDDLNVAHRVARELRAGRRRRQRVLRGRHDDAVRRLQAVRLRRPRQVGPRARPVHRDQDDLDPAPTSAGAAKAAHRRPRCCVQRRALRLAVRTGPKTDANRSETCANVGRPRPYAGARLSPRPPETPEPFPPRPGVFVCARRTPPATGRRVARGSRTSTPASSAGTRGRPRSRP